MNPTQTTSIAWTLQAPGANGTAKEYRVMLVDRHAVVGFGTAGKSLQYNVVACGSAELARQWALDQTSMKERKGYVLHVLPHQRTSRSGITDWLVQNHEHRGGSTKLDEAFAGVFRHGSQIAA